MDGDNSDPYEVAMRACIVWAKDQLENPPDPTPRYFHLLEEARDAILGAPSRRDLAMFGLGFLALDEMLSGSTGKQPTELADMVSRLSQSQAARAKSRALLPDEQYAVVLESVSDEMKLHGLSEIQACRNAASQLMTGTFNLLPGVRVEITAEAIKKQRLKARSSS